MSQQIQEEKSRNPSHQDNFPNAQKLIKSITVVIACLNEEENLQETYEGVVQAIISSLFKDYEIIIVNDGSQDRTGEIADNIAGTDPHVRVIHNEINKGFGSSFNLGLKHSTMTYITVVPGDNEIMPESIEKILKAVGKADIVTSYTENTEVRPFYRRFLSICFTTLINLLFNNRLKYYNGPNVYQVGQVTPIGLENTNFSFNAEAVIRLLRSGSSVIEVGMKIRKKKSYRTRALKINNLLNVLRSVFRLFFSLRKKTHCSRLAG